MPGQVETFALHHFRGKTRWSSGAGDAVVALDQVRKNRDLWEFRLRIRYDGAAGGLESHRGWIFKNECF